MSPQEYSQKIRDNIVFFAREELGIELSEKQEAWVTHSVNRINILTPGNQWGKTLTTATKHLHHAMTKPKLQGKVHDREDWLKAEYETLNFGLTYEIAKPVKDYMVKIAEGELLITDPKTGESHFNESKLKGWAIISHKDNPLPEIIWSTGAKSLFRSFDNMGSSFKAKRLAYVSGDECGDIPNLQKFVNGTLLPRVVKMNGNIDLVGTPQADKDGDYSILVERAKDDDEELYYYQSGSMYENTFLEREAVKEIERIADPELRRQIIYGEFVNTGEKYFDWAEISNAIDPALQLVSKDHGGKYIASADFAAAEDYTVFIVIDYSREPFDVVYLKRFKGKSISIPMQYELFKALCKAFHARGIIDASGLGGKNAASFLSEINPIEFNFTPKSKAEMLASLKIAFQGSNTEKLKRDIEEDKGVLKDRNPLWGCIRIPNIPELIKELQNYRLDDEGIKNDQVMALGMAIHWIEIRRPKTKRSVIDIDLLSL